MRKIDADRLKDAIYTDFWEHFTQCHDSDQTALIDMVMDDIDEMPALTPPNEQLTLDDLRKMDGEPVWIDDEKTWALLQVWDGDNIDAVFPMPRGCFHAESVIGKKIYRRPPEGEEDT